MTAPATPDADATIRKALGEIRTLRARLRAAEDAARQPIAVVGMGLRLPGGVSSPEAYERLLWSGRDAISEVPEDRWDRDAFDAMLADVPDPGGMRFGGFLDDVKGFDNGFFNISPVEADSMDPQQRLALEVAWEALEHAAIAPSSLHRSATGVYLGIAGYDYGRAIMADPETVEPHYSTGTLLSVAAGRIAYFLGAQGPAVAIDTACSSSLVALHLACQGLRNRECDLALAGGVNAMLSPEIHLAFCKGRMLAADGRCKSFDAAADGYVRGEGCGMLALRRLDEAEARGERILGVILGSAVNHDGRSGGLTAPNGPAQEAVIRAALDRAGVDPAAISMIEAHGTGTPLGDPIEMGALSAVYCDGRTAERPLLVGSAKTVVGHLEAAAGVAGLAKALLALRRREMPGNLNFRAGNPEIDWSQPLAVPSAPVPLDAGDGAPMAAVSSFGISGTNAHLIVAAAPEGGADEVPGPRRSGHVVLSISAQSATALAHLARGYSERLEAGAEPESLCFTANAGRSHFRHRLAVTGRDAPTLLRGLEDFAGQRPSDGYATGASDGAARPRVAFLFSGQGGHRPGMARGLLDTSRAFRRAVERADAALGTSLGASISDVLLSDDAGLLKRTEIAQPVQVAVQCALVDLWRTFGVVPDMVLGHSLGEYAAAYAAGVFALEDAVRAAAARGRALAALPAGGTMASVIADPEALEAELRRSEGRITVAAYNGAPGNVSLSGEAAALEASLARLDGTGARTRMLDIPFAAHSPRVESAVGPLEAALSKLPMHPARIPVVSTVTGATAEGAALARPRYWGDNLRAPVRFAEAARVLAGTDVTHALELGPHPALIGAAAEGPAGRLALLASLHRDRDDWEQVLESLASLYADGAEIDWGSFEADAGPAPRPVDAPTYAFDRVPRWIETARAPREDRGWDRMTETVAVDSERVPLDIDIRAQPRKTAFLDRVTVAVAVDALRSAKLFETPGERLRTGDIVGSLGVPDDFVPLLERWLGRLRDAGILSEAEGCWTAPGPLPADDLADLWDEAEPLFADDRGLLDYVRHCAGLAGDVIRGRVQPLETLFPDGSFDLAEGLYERSAAMRYVNGLAGSAVTALSGAVGQGRALRVLEAGAGTGGTTRALLARLPAGSVEYVFTDVSNAFLDQARERFGDRGDVTFRLLDLEAAPEDQGFEAGSFDLVVSANAVHAVRDLPSALGRLRGLLRPGGCLMLIESTESMSWFDITTGLIEGWRHFDDTLREDSPLLSPNAWRGALDDAGFEAAQAWPRSGSPAESFGQHLILARRPGAALAGSAARPVAATGDAETTASPALRAALEDATEADRIDLLRDHAGDMVARVLGLEPEERPGRSERLMDLGLDSLMALRLRSLLGQGLDLPEPLPASIAFDHPTIDAIARDLHDRLFAASGPEPAPEAPAVPDAAPAGTDVSRFTDAEVEALLLAKLDRS